MYIPFRWITRPGPIFQCSSRFIKHEVFLGVLEKASGSDVAISNLLLIDKMSSPVDIAKKPVKHLRCWKTFSSSQAVKWSLKWIEMDGHPHLLVSSKNLPKNTKNSPLHHIFLLGSNTIVEVFTVCFPILHGRLGHAFRVSHSNPFRRGVRLHLFLPKEGGKEQVWALTSHRQKKKHTYIRNLATSMKKYETAMLPRTMEVEN